MMYLSNNNKKQNHYRNNTTTFLSFFFGWILLLLFIPSDATATNNSRTTNIILVVGSMNADTFLPISRFPQEGENIVTNGPPEVDLPGGKGCTQAVAASKIFGGKVRFIGQFGCDDASKIFHNVLKDVDCSHCGHHDDILGGRGYVLLNTEEGSVSAVVSGGSNLEGWKEWETIWKKQQQQEEKTEGNSINFDAIFQDVKCVMLQREVPEYVNLLVATEAKKRHIPILQDIGGEDRPISKRMLSLCDYIIPNETELVRLVRSFSSFKEESTNNMTKEDVVKYAKLLQSYGAKNVLVSRGKKGCLLLLSDAEIIEEKGFSVDDVIDETGAGDCFRAAFAVALLKGGKSSSSVLQNCMKFACAAGACAVTKKGAVPSTPTRSQVENLYNKNAIATVRGGERDNKQADTTILKRGGGGGEQDNNNDDTKFSPFPFLIGSRLNSMKDRSELWTDSSLKTPKDFVKRQSRIKGLTCVDFNYPQHFTGYWTAREAKEALVECGLLAGAVCLRYPANQFARGAMNHPDQALRRRAIELTKEAAAVAQELGCNEVVVWSAFDGYDYPFQVNYDDKWDQLVEAFRECCDAYPKIKFSIEFKPTDENTRFSTVPSTGASLLLANEVDRSNFGLTLDVGHMLMAGENPGQSVAMVGRAKRLFGIQLNDGYTRLAAEDGLMFGSVHPSMALEVLYQLKRNNFKGHFYFDTFPQRTDPVREAEYNIQRLKRFWKAATEIKDIQKITSEHDAIGALQLVDRALYTSQQPKQKQ